MCVGVVLGMCILVFGVWCWSVRECYYPLLVDIGKKRMEWLSVWVFLFSYVRRKKEDGFPSEKIKK